GLWDRGIRRGLRPGGTDDHRARGVGHGDLGLELPVRLMRRALALAAVIALLPVLPAGATFIDDDGRPGEKALEWLAVRGVIDGCNPPHDDAACPARVLTRAEAAKILV